MQFHILVRHCKNMKVGNPVLLVFREVLEGDVKKQKAKSNISDSGGGARDLRFRGSDVFGPILTQFFLGTIKATGVYKTRVYWFDDNNSTSSTELEFWPPTNARPNEVRLSKIHRIKGWEIDEIAYNRTLSNGNTMFFYLVLDDLGNVWARLFDTEFLNQETQIVKDYLKEKLLNKKQKTAIFGSIDFRTLKTFP